jgi:hypothetical protein
LTVEVGPVSHRQLDMNLEPAVTGTRGVPILDAGGQPGKINGDSSVIFRPRITDKSPLIFTIATQRRSWALDTAGERSGPRFAGQTPQLGIDARRRLRTKRRISAVDRSMSA